MKVEFTSKFEKDIHKVDDNLIKKQLLFIIQNLEVADSLQSVPNIKKLKGAKTAYRIRIGTYRLGFFFENNSCILARFLHRKDIYNNFP